MQVGRQTYLLHNTSLTLGKGNVTTRLVLDELDLDLATLTARLVIVIVVVLGAHAAALGTAGVSAVARLLQVVVVWRELLLTDSGHIGHLERGTEKTRREVTEVG